MTTHNSSLVHLFFGQNQISSSFSNLALLLLRVYAGYTILKAGIDKLPLPDWMTDQVMEMGFPFPALFAWLASFSEFAFGALLVLGLMTRLSGLLLAIIMGFASFVFQDVRPLLDMHIAQHFFWIFTLFAFMGGGKFSIDYWLNSQFIKKGKNYFWLPIPAFLVFLGLGLYWEGYPVEPAASDDDSIQIQSINVAGAFNNWDPSVNVLKDQGEGLFQIDLPLGRSGPTEFKFTANKSWDFNLGEADQVEIGFPIEGVAEKDQGGNTQNIRAYIPASGIYRFTLDINTYNYTLELPSPEGE